MRPRFRLIVITDGAPALVERLSRLAPALREGVAILLRDPPASREALLAQAHALRGLTRKHGAALLISRSIEVALASDADGVHLPEPTPTAEPAPAPPSLAAARERLGVGKVVGASRHDLAGVLAAAREGADYATLSPVFPSPGKGEPLGLTAFADVARATPLPLYALGGVQLAQVTALRSAGAAGIAVIREVLAASDPAAALTALMRALAGTRSS